MAIALRQDKNPHRFGARSVRIDLACRVASFQDSPDTFRDVAERALEPAHSAGESGEFSERERAGAVPIYEGLMKDAIPIYEAR